MMEESIFDICTGLLEWFGHMTGLTYEEASVVFNLWIQSTVLWLSALVPFIIAVAKAHHNKCNLRTLCLTSMIVTIYSLGYSWIFIHYGTNMENAYNICTNDLYYLAKLWHTSYSAVNIIIFVIGWLLTFTANVLITLKLIRQHTKTLV